MNNFDEITNEQLDEYSTLLRCDLPKDFQNLMFDRIIINEKVVIKIYNVQRKLLYKKTIPFIFKKGRKRK